MPLSVPFPSFERLAEMSEQPDGRGKLKPCPWCGDNPVVEPGTRPYAGAAKKAYVTCDICSYTLTFLNLKALTDYWNTRPSIDRMAELLKRLKSHQEHYLHDVGYSVHDGRTHDGSTDDATNAIEQIDSVLSENGYGDT
jgi:hypothetical protein